MKSLKFILAWLRLSKSAVCEMSDRRHEFHHHADAEAAIDLETFACRRCGRVFSI